MTNNTIYSFFIFKDFLFLRSFLYGKVASTVPVCFDFCEKVFLIFFF